ncbi:MAG: ferrous iron transport protein A [Deltaproteobacteria bacterium]|nr:ferrous iron transport protein A [Deltaproteobacteria bacterium]
MGRVLPLRQMAVGARGVIAKVKARGEMNRRIRDMGLVKGTPIKIHGRAPLYDPVNIKLRDYNLTLRNNEADFILVEVED